MLPVAILPAATAINVVPLVSASGNKAAAAAAATLAADGNSTVYLSGFEVSGAGATASSIIQITVTGILGGTLTYIYVVPAGVGVVAPTWFVEFSVPIPAADVNTSIVVNVPSFGAGNTNAALVAHGFKVPAWT